MKTTERFDRAVTKLYNAFHKGDLDAFDCQACVVGNMCDGYGGWFGGRTRFGLPIEDFTAQEKTGYSAEQLGIIEELFINECSLKNRVFHENSEERKQEQFEGLCAVVEYLCELDGIPNVMDYTSLFEYTEKGPVKELII